MTLEEIINTYGQIPDLTSFDRLMFVGPHPDDIEFGCGGLISRLKELNKEVTYVIVTDGAAGSMDPSITPEMMKETRKQETLDAAKFMNVKNVEFLDLEDGGNYSLNDVIKRLAKVVLNYNPQIIFTSDHRLKTECHNDHIMTGEAVSRLMQIVPHPESLRRQGVDVSEFKEFPNNITLAYYFTDDANTKVMISENNLNEKLASIQIHKSQMDESIKLLLGYFSLKAQKLGEGKGLAEDYKVQVPLTQHVYSEGVHY